MFETVLSSTSVLSLLSHRSQEKPDVFTGHARRLKTLVQDTLCKALASKEQYDPTQRLVTWLSAIMRNSFIDEYRANRRMPLEQISSSDFTSTVPPAQDWAVRVSEVEIALKEIPLSNRHLLIKVAIGNTYLEVSALTGLNVGTVKTRVRRERQRLNDRFQPSFPSWSESALTLPSGNFSRTE